MAVEETGPQFTPFSLFRCGPQRYSAVRTSLKERESGARDLRLRRHQPPQSLRAGGQRPGNPTPAAAGCRRGAFSHLSGRRRLRDLRYQQPAGLALSGLPAGSGRHPGCGVHRPHRAALAGYHGEHPRPATARSQDSQPGRQRTVLGQYLDADPESPESFLGYTLAGFAAWVSDQELVSIRRRTRAGLEKAKADGKKLGAPRRLSEEQEAAVIEMVGSGVSQRRVARSFGVSPATVRRAVKRE